MAMHSSLFLSNPFGGHPEASVIWTGCVSPEWIQAAPVSPCQATTGHCGGRVNTDSLTSVCAKHRARGCDMNQPSLPNSAHGQLMRSPSGLKQPLKSTCSDCEEARDARPRGPHLSPNIHPVRGMRKTNACHTVVRDQLC